MATLKLIEVGANGTRVLIHVEIGRPYPDGKGAWACPIRVDGLDAKVREIHGEDSFQALCLGLRLVRVHLESVLDRGSRLVHADEDTDFPLDAYFEGLRGGSEK